MASPKLQTEFDRLYPTAPLRMCVNARPDASFQRQQSPRTRDLEWEERSNRIGRAWSGFFLGCIIGVLALMFWAAN